MTLYGAFVALLYLPSLGFLFFNIIGSMIRFKKWEFFKLQAFGYDSLDKTPELENIEERLLPKLKGSPLGAKTIGRLLRMNLNPKHWTNILNSEL